MKKFAVLSIAMLLMMMGCAANQTQEISRLNQEVVYLKALVGPPPSSLDRQYPPAAPAPLYQIEMFKMETPLTGVVIETERGNFELARAHFQKFKTQYVEVSRMVPEWEKAYPLQPLDDLSDSLKTNDQGRVMASFGALIEVCNNCHFANMPKVQQKYHWEDSSGIEVSDPVTKADLKYNQLMAFLNMSFTGISVDLQQGQVDNAVRQFESFDKRFKLMKETCKACHETERKYYVDESVQALIDKLGVTLRSSPPDMEQVEQLRRQIGTESCMKCHLVHIPAAYSKVVWMDL